MLNLAKDHFFKEAKQCDWLIELYVRRDEARRDDDWREARHLQHQIEETAAERNELCRLA